MTAILMATSILFSSCASIVSKASYPISINSAPSEAKIVIFIDFLIKYGIDINGMQLLSSNQGADFLENHDTKYLLIKMGMIPKLFLLNSNLTDGILETYFWAEYWEC